MLTQKQIKEIREHLEKARNPVFFYDVDADGLCSFLLLARWIGRGKGVVTRNFRESGTQYIKRAEELGADYIFVLDNPTMPQEFVDEINKMNIPLVVIDHHDVPRLDSIEFYYNTVEVSGKNESVSYLCYEITKQKKDMWLAVVGSIADCQMLGFFKEFAKENSDLVDCEYESAFDVRYKCKLGKIIDIFNYGLKDTTTNVVRMSNFLLKVNFPSEIFEENYKTKSFLDRYNFIEGIIKKLIDKAEDKIDLDKKLLFFSYGGCVSVSQHLADRLMYKYPELVIVVGYNLGGGIIKFSLRGPIDVRELTLNAIENIHGATGGGHKHATGAQIPENSVEKFKRNLEKGLEN